MKRTSRALLAFAAVSALALSGCAGGGSQSGQSGQSGEESSALALQDLNLQPRDALQQGGTLRMSITSMPDNYNQFHVNGNNADFSNPGYGIGAAFLLPANWLYQGDGTFDVNPNYVESFSSEVVDGKQVVNMKLNPNAVWGDGTPVSVADYVATWKACNGENTDFICASTDGYDAMESVEQGENEFDLIVTYDSVYPDWSAALSTVNAASGMKDAETFNDGWLEPNNDWFAGPFQVAKFDTAQQAITLEPNPKWWGEAPLLDSVFFRAMDPAGSGNAFANGELDVLTGIINGDQYAQAATRADGEIRRAGGLTWRHFTFNGEDTILSDVAVRQAVARGINREAITAADLAGIPDLVPSELVLGNHFFMPGQFGFQDNSADFAFDPERAGSELDALGWVLADGSEYRAKEGKTLEFDYAMMPDISTSKTEGEMLQSQMKDIGVKVNIVNVSTDEFFSDTVLNGKFGVTAFAWVGTPYPLHNVGQLYACDQIAPNGGNYTRTCVPEIDELIPQIAAEADVDARNALGNQADQLVWENVMFFPLYRRIEMTAVPANLANFGAFGMSNVQSENIGYLAE